MAKSIVVSRLTAASLLILFLSSCVEKISDHTDEVYTLWSGEKPTSEVKIIHGKYWESAHWSKEYIIFLEMKACKDWVDAFVKENHLVPDTSGIGIAKHPDWFTPSKGFLVFRKENDFSGLRYYFNLKEDHVFIYEARL